MLTLYCLYYRLASILTFIFSPLGMLMAQERKEIQTESFPANYLSPPQRPPTVALGRNARTLGRRKN